MTQTWLVAMCCCLLRPKDLVTSESPAHLLLKFLQATTSTVNEPEESCVKRNHPPVTY